jgi:hypothetical protein
MSTFLTRSTSPFVVDHYQMVIDMKEERLGSIKQLAQFLKLTAVSSPRRFIRQLCIAVQNQS